jgi:hypothetical protein
MPYTNLDRCYHISRLCSYKYGEKVTDAQLKDAIFMIVRSKSPDVINRYIAMLQEDNGDLAKPQFGKKDGFWIPTPNRPKSPNQLIAQAYRENEAEKGGLSS